MKTILTILLLLTASVTYAVDYPVTLATCIRYIHVVEQGQTLPANERDLWEQSMQGDRLVVSKWRGSYPVPTAQHCVDISATAVTWWANREKDELSDFDGWTNEQLKATIKALVKKQVEEFNRSRQWDAALKAAIADAVSLADLKARVAVLPARPDISLVDAAAELKAAIKAELE